MAAKKTSPAAKPAKKMNKTKFVLSMPLDTPTNEVLQKAKEAGLSLTERYVWNIRSTARSAKGSGRKRRGGRPPKTAVAQRMPTRSVSDDASTERTFLRLVLDLGRARAEAIFNGVKAKLDALERG